MKEEDMHKYDDIIELPRHVSDRHPQMALSDRAAQFSPFAALTGYKETVQEAARHTEKKAALAPEEEELLNETLLLLQEEMAQGRRISVTVTYFMPDTKKEGGSYRRETGFLKKIDSIHKNMIFENGCHIPLEDIMDVEKDLNF